MTLPRKVDSHGAHAEHLDEELGQLARPRRERPRRRRAPGIVLQEPGYSSLTIHAQEPEGTTTCSERAKRSTVRAATCAASSW